MNDESLFVLDYSAGYKETRPIYQYMICDSQYLI